jgi:GxxExxY protein
MQQSPNGSRDADTYAVIGAAMEVHRVLGCGFLEAVYQEALAEELRMRAIDCLEQVYLPIAYKGVGLRTHYRVDFVIDSTVILEIKALDAITGRERSQLINYLRASGISRGLLLNFGAERLQYERLVWKHPSASSPSSASSA